MHIVQAPEAKKIVKSYLNGYITVEELREELEWYWDRKVYKGTKTPILDRNGVPSFLPLRSLPGINE
jgi:hypothetical protein